MALINGQPSLLPALPLVPMLVAPVTVGENATIGAGSVIKLKTPPPNELTLAGIKQKTVFGWKPANKR